MSSFTRKLISTLFNRPSTRPAAPRRRAALRIEPLEMRAVLSTVLPTPPVADLQLDNSTEILASTRSGTGGGAGKVAMQDFHFVARSSLAIDSNAARQSVEQISLNGLAAGTYHVRETIPGSGHTSGVNVAFGDGSVRFVSSSVSTSVWATDAANDRTPQAPTGTGGSGTLHGTGFYHLLPSSADVDPIEDLIIVGGPQGHVKAGNGAEIRNFLASGSFPGLGKVGGGHLILPGLEQTGSHAGSGGGHGKVAFQDLHTLASSATDDDPIVLGASINAHVKAFSGATGAEIRSFLAFPGFNGGVFVGSASSSPSRGFTLQPFGGFLGGTRVAVGDIDTSGHGTHVAGTIGSDPSATVHTGAALHLKPATAGASAPASSKSDAAAVDTGIDYSHPDLYQNLWTNHHLDRLIDDLAHAAAK